MRDAGTWARNLGISKHAADLYLNSDVVDLHIDSFIWTRIFGYQLQRRHGQGLLAARYCRQVDIPRIRDAQISGATWIITTNPWRTAQGRARVFTKNLERLTGILESQPNDVRIVSTASEYDASRNAGLHAAFLGVQGANAFEERSAWTQLQGGRILLVTLVHLTDSAVGCTSSFLRWRSDRGLSPLGREFVEYLNNQNILVDLAHASKRTFWDAVAVHCRCAPLLVSHTGIDSAHRHWRNLNDDQLRAVADSGGVVGIFFHGPFLGSGPFGGRVWRVAKHIAAAVRLIGADHVALGSDWDGMTPTPLDMRTCLELPKLVQAMLDEKLSDEQIHSVLGGSFNRLLRMIRP